MGRLLFDEDVDNNLFNKGEVSQQTRVWIHYNAGGNRRLDNRDGGVNLSIRQNALVKKSINCPRCA